MNKTLKNILRDAESGDGSCELYENAIPFLDRMKARGLVSYARVPPNKVKVTVTYAGRHSLLGEATK